MILENIMAASEDFITPGSDIQLGTNDYKKHVNLDSGTDALKSTMEIY